MPRMNSTVALPGRANPFGIMGIRGVRFEGAIEYRVEKYCSFQSMIYSIRALFSLMRYWQRYKGADTVCKIVDCIYWLDVADRTYFKTVLATQYTLENDAAFDYRSPMARTLARALAKYVSKWDLTEEDLQVAQAMIL